MIGLSLISLQLNLKLYVFVFIAPFYGLVNKIFWLVNGVRKYVFEKSIKI